MCTITESGAARFWRVLGSRHKPRRVLAASTLPEMMVALAIGSLALSSVMMGYLFYSRSFAAMGNYCELNQASRQSLDAMTRDIRQAKVVGYYSTNQLTLTNLDGSSFTYGWNPSSALVYRLAGASSNVVMKGCDYFCFHIWQRNPTNGFLFPYSATNQPSLTKLVDVSWRCSRTILQQKINTESVQTAKIVLRN